MTKILGIDLGTYNSAAAIADTESEGSDPKIVRSQENSGNEFEKSKAFPSFVSYHPDGKVDQVGLAAKEQLIIDPQRVFWGMKRLISKTYTELREQGELERYLYAIEPDPETGKCFAMVGDKKFSPEVICGEIIKKIKSEAEKEINGSFDEVVISIPAYFDAAYATPIVQMAKKAGFNSIKTVPEPVAASLAYNVSIGLKPQRVLVFDLGAGTLDVTAGNLIRKGLSPSEITFHGKITTGDPILGGIDMDDRITWLLKEKTGLLETVLSSVDEMKIRREAEKAKIRLSKEIRTEIAFKVMGNSYSLGIDRIEMEMALRGKRGERDLIESCRKQVIEALKGALWTPEDVDQILPIGGPSCMPCILQIHKEVFRKNPRVLNQIEQIENGSLPVDPMEAVAKGAALFSKTRKIIPHPYGYGFVDAEIHPEEIIHKAQILVPRGSAVPCMSESFWIPWYRDAATTEIEIIQHVPEAESHPEYRHLGYVDIALKEKGKGLIEIEMGLNDNEELITKLRDMNTGKEIQYIGIGHLRRMPIKLPRTMKIREPTGPESGNPFSSKKTEVDETALKDLINWAQTVLKLCRAKMENVDPEIANNIRSFVNELNETFIFHVWDDKGNPVLQKAKEHWNDIINTTSPLLHRSAELELLEDNMGAELKKSGDDIKNRLFKRVNQGS